MASDLAQHIPLPCGELASPDLVLGVYARLPCFPSEKADITTVPLSERAVRERQPAIRATGFCPTDREPNCSFLPREQLTGNPSGRGVGGASSWQSYLQQESRDSRVGLSGASYDSGRAHDGHTMGWRPQLEAKARPLTDRHFQRTSEVELQGFCLPVIWQRIAAGIMVRGG